MENIMASTHAELEIMVRTLTKFVLRKNKHEDLVLYNQIYEHIERQVTKGDGVEWDVLLSEIKDRRDDGE
jgi:hypothetical protein